jgi:hypothetical protein
MRTPVAPHDDSRPRLAHDFTRRAPTCRSRFYMNDEGDFLTQKTKQKRAGLETVWSFVSLIEPSSYPQHWPAQAMFRTRAARGLNGSFKSAIAYTSLSSIWIFAGIAKDFACLCLSARTKPFTDSLVDDDLEVVFVTFYNRRY